MLSYNPLEIRLIENLEALQAYIENKLGAEKMKALSKIIHFVDEDDIYGIVEFDRLCNYDNYMYKRDFSQIDFIRAFRLLLTDDDIEAIKFWSQGANLLSSRAKVTDKFLRKLYNWGECNNINDKYDLWDTFNYTKILIADKYYDYFTRENVKKFLRINRKLKKFLSKRYRKDFLS
ncbi:hypothetical protein YZ82_01365 [Campylobacter hyointestinalis]|uniref:Uncharacterized protein n=1 Tax=Campylobacter hyointestinalis TaxID=198 RepID=A0A562XKA5_CAMHY|nr:hypothetical protein [Campylobacter hyointestinalis]TWO22592.1 hypothetical protein YZ82_01365 [Campylobacter hyointestinalis]